MDYTFNFTSLIKRLLFVSCFTLTFLALADDKQDVIIACYSEIGAGDYKSAFPLCKLAAEQGDASAQYYMGLMYFYGKGTPKDYKQAVYWYTKAAKQGYAGAQLNLGTMYSNGKGTPKDYKQAVYWYTKAAKQGHASAQFNLGIMHDFGKGTLKDSVMAYAWYNVAATQKDEQSAKNRSLIEKEMTPSQIEKAQTLSKELYSKYVK